MALWIGIRLAVLSVLARACGTANSCNESQAPAVIEAGVLQLIQTNLQLGLERNDSQHHRSRSTTKISPHVAHEVGDGKREHAGSGKPGTEVDAKTVGFGSTENVLAVFLLAFVVLIMCLFYLVNWPDEDIQRETWKILNTTLAIFGAILIFNAIKDVSMRIFGEHEIPQAEGYTKPFEYNMILPSVYRFLAIDAVFLALVMFLHFVKRPTAPLATMGGHVVAFAGIDAFGGLQQCVPFAGSPVNSLGAVVASACLFALLFVFHTVCLNALASMLAIDDWEDAREEMVEVENDVVGLVLSLLICQAVKFAIVGQLAPIYGYPHGKTIRQIEMLLGAAIAFTIVALFPFIWRKLLRFATNPSPNSKQGKGWLQALSALVESVLTFTVSWCLLYSGQWFFGNITDDSGLGDGDEMLALIIMAFAASALGIVIIFVLDFFADHGILGRTRGQRLINAVGLLLGLSWEQTFDRAVDSIAEAFGMGQEQLATGFSFFFFWLLVAPAWALYIQPSAAAHTQKTKSSDEASAHGSQGSEPVRVVGTVGRPQPPTSPLALRPYNFGSQGSASVGGSGTVRRSQPPTSPLSPAAYNFGPQGSESVRGVGTVSRPQPPTSPLVQRAHYFRT